MSLEQEGVIDRVAEVDELDESMLTEGKPGKAPATKPAADKEDSLTYRGKFLASQKQLDATQLYLNEIGFSPLLTPEEEVYFARLARKGEESGRKRMIESNLRLVV